MEKHLHIICFTIPYPVNYGGLFDLFYKLWSLQQRGVYIHLHCFVYNKQQPQSELNKYCCNVHYYKRNKFIYSKLPNIVASRKNENLLQNLLKDDYPIFMEGIHSTYLLNDKRFADRKKFVRIHNVEHTYYKQLQKDVTSVFKKWYYKRESRLLKYYEKSIINKATAFWGVSHKDVAVYRDEFGCTTINYLPVYLPATWQVQCLKGKGSYCLYHGDLSVASNEKIVVWLLKNVFNTLSIPFVIAGKNPSSTLMALAYKHQHTCLVANPNEKEMQDIIAKAHIHILPATSNTGIKLKLLNALFNGRHCIVNKDVVENTGLATLCHIANDAASIKERIQTLFEEDFTGEVIELRKKILPTLFNNEQNAKQQVEWIWRK